jgi:hypothetical protein
MNSRQDGSPVQAPSPPKPRAPWDTPRLEVLSLLAGTHAGGSNVDDGEGPAS